MPTRNRPLSPHLQVYKPQLTSVLSILHRGTGFVITMGAVIIAWWIWGVAGSGENFTSVSGFLNSVFGKALLLIWTLCTCYHLCNGIRHLFWDFGLGFELDQAYFSGKLVLAATVILTSMVWLL